MSIRKLFFLFMLIMCNACSSDVFLDHNGNMPDKDKVALVKNGQTKDEVLDILGAPSSVTGLNDNHWIYMSSTLRKVAFLTPKEVDRQVLAIRFDNDIVTKIETKNLADGNDIAIDTDETKATEAQQGFFRKYFGGVGTYMPFGSPNSSKDL